MTGPGSVWLSGAHAHDHNAIRPAQGLSHRGREDGGDFYFWWCPDVFLPKLQQHLGGKGYFRCICNRIPLIFFNLSSINLWGQNHFWLTILKKVFGTTCSLPSYVYSSGKNSCAARKLCLQHNWPEKLPKYLTQKGVVYQAIDFWGSESISVPQPGANEL